MLLHCVHLGYGYVIFFYKSGCKNINNYFNTVFTQYSNNWYITYEESLVVSHRKISIAYDVYVLIV